MEKEAQKGASYEAPQAEVTIKDLLEAGAHFGHQKRRWNPKMKRFVFEERNGLHIIDLAKTLEQLRVAVEVVQKTVASRKSILFVGTKKQAKSVVSDCAERSGEFFVSERWLGGMLTNMATIRRSVKTLERIEKKLSQAGSGLTKKELSLLSKEQLKLEKHLSGVRSMRKLPGLLIVVDPVNERIAVAEANRLHIPVMALADTNCNPDPIHHVIPCNDDALKSIKLIMGALTQAVIDKKNELQFSLEKQEEEEEISERSSQLDPDTEGKE